MLTTFRPLRSGVRRAVLFAAALGFSAPALASEGARTLAVTHLEAGTLAVGEEALAAMVAADPADDDAKMGLGTIQFIRSVETLSQGLYRYGLVPPRSFLVPVVRLPVPPNPNPQSITYADFRGLLETFMAGIGKAETTLAGVDSADAKLVLDLMKLRYDANGDGTVGEDEAFIAVIQRVTGFTASDMPEKLVFAFDKADAIWLRGYANVLLAFGEFLMAHDWHESFDAAFHNFFPNSQSEFAAKLARGEDFLGEAGPIADFISFMHMRWPVADKARMIAAHDRMKTVLKLSRENFAAIDAETDDDREWFPNPRQTSPFASISVDAERMRAWGAVLDEADAILDGTKLIPHWRFNEGINFRKIFYEPRDFDIVLWATGPAALPYLEAGPVTKGEDWNAMTAAFEGSFGVFAIWAN